MGQASNMSIDDALESRDFVDPARVGRKALGERSVITDTLDASTTSPHDDCAKIRPLRRMNGPIPVFQSRRFHVGIVRLGCSGFFVAGHEIGEFHRVHLVADLFFDVG